MSSWVNNSTEYNDIQIFVTPFFRIHNAVATSYRFQLWMARICIENSKLFCTLVYS